MRASLAGDEKANTGPLRRELAAIVRENPAIALIERLLSTPDGAAVNSENSAGMTLAELRLRWEWDSLRSNPRLQKILAGPEPKTIY